MKGCQYLPKIITLNKLLYVETYSNELTKERVMNQEKGKLNKDNYFSFKKKQRQLLRGPSLIALFEKSEN